jgi:pSer/pThr/pTyr-binding forkhead associated (FHA) protein
MAHFRIEKTVLSDRRLPCPGRVVVLGRSLDADVPLPHKSVSRRHALIEMQQNGFVISDLGSSNGTWIGERRLAEGERLPLKLGDRFRLGHVVLVLAPDEVLEGDEPAPPDPSPPGAVKLAAVAPPRAMPKAAPPPPKREVSRSTVKERRRPRPEVAKRQAHRKAKRDAMRWIGLAVTVLLLTLAGIFVGKIVGRANEDRERAEAKAAEEEAAREAEQNKPVEVTPLERR